MCVPRLRAVVCLLFCKRKSLEINHLNYCSKFKWAVLMFMGHGGWGSSGQEDTNSYCRTSCFSTRLFDIFGLCVYHTFTLIINFFNLCTNSSYDMATATEICPRLRTPYMLPTKHLISPSISMPTHTPHFVMSSWFLPQTLQGENWMLMSVKYRGSSPNPAAHCENQRVVKGLPIKMFIITIKWQQTATWSSSTHSTSNLDTKIPQYGAKNKVFHCRQQIAINKRKCYHQNYEGCALAFFVIDYLLQFDFMYFGWLANKAHC